MAGRRRHPSRVPTETRPPPPGAVGTVDGVQVTFRKLDTKGRTLCRWDAVRNRRVRVPGTTMGAGDGSTLPHDLTQYVIEAATGYRNGFWELVAKGATFKTTGRRRTRPGRAVIAEHRAELLKSEQHAQRHTATWLAGERTPVTEALDRALEQWRALDEHHVLVFAWPSASGTVEAVETQAGGEARR